MTTAVRQLPPHGTQYRYRGPVDGSWPGCRCAKCTHANHVGGKARRLAHLRGEGPLYPGAPVLEHINKLYASGMTYALIARRAKVSDATITNLVHGYTKSCKRDKAFRILAVKPADFDELALRPATGSIRRLRALYAIGHNPKAISAVTGFDETAVSHFANDRYTVITLATEQRIGKAYRELSATPGLSGKARKRAESQGWRDPQWWEDYGRIDDPEFDPDKADAELNFHERAKLRREEIIHLAWIGHQPEQIRERLDNEVSIATVRSVVQEWRTGQKRQRKQVAA
ncbi:hypothetical protein ABT150_23125 [Streptomyces mirabilis]|uniref:hypothetical protein n=1 Tax=Streptomyces mirabilis TaxID=68239 RepID=UPI003324ADA3